MSGLDVPKFGVMPGEDPKKTAEKVESANMRTQERLANEARESLQRQVDSELGAKAETSAESAVTPESLMKDISKDLVETEKAFAIVEGGEIEKGKAATKIERGEILARIQGELPHKVKYFKDVNERLQIRDKEFVLKLNKLEAYSDYIRDVRI